MWPENVALSDIQRAIQTREPPNDRREARNEPTIRIDNVSERTGEYAESRRWDARV